MVTSLFLPYEIKKPLMICFESPLNKPHNHALEGKK